MGKTYLHIQESRKHTGHLKNQKKTSVAVKIMLCKISTRGLFYSGQFRGVHTHYRGTKVAQWLGCCVTNRKVTGSIPDGVIGNFHSHNPSDCTMALGSTQSLTEMSTRRISWG